MIEKSQKIKTLFQVVLWGIASYSLYLFQKVHTIDDDEWEHLTAACEIALGKLPFVDFFEHHIPTFWILLAPFCSEIQTSENIEIWRIIMICFSLIGLYFLSRLCGGGVLITMLCLSSLNLAVFREKLIEIRPDVLAFCALCCGLTLLNQSRTISYKTYMGVFILGVSCSLQFKFYILMLVPLLMFYFKFRIIDLIKHIVVALIPTALLFLWLIMNGALIPFIENVLILNSHWPESFPIWTWIASSYEKNTLIFVLGLLASVWVLFYISAYKNQLKEEGRLFEYLEAPLFLTLSIVMVCIVPNPYPQTFIPFIIGLFWNLCLGFKLANKNLKLNPVFSFILCIWLFPVLILIDYIEKEKESPNKQFKQWETIIEYSKGRRLSVLSFIKAHPGMLSGLQPGWCYDAIVEVLQIQDMDQRMMKAWETTDVAFIDHKMKTISPKACQWIAENSLQLGEKKSIRIHGLKLNGIDFFDGELDFKVLKPGMYKVEIEPEQTYRINGESKSESKTFELKAGMNKIECDEFVDTVTLRLVK